MSDDLSADTIRKAVTTHHGGLAMATDAQLLRLWHSLDEATQQRYLAAVRSE